MKQFHFTFMILGGVLTLLLVTSATRLSASQNPSSDTKNPPADAKSQPEPSKPQNGKQEAIPGSRVTVEVTGGEKDVPVENASVYLKYVEEHIIKKNKKFEMNVKTNQDGTAHIPDVPLGRVLIQVVADGWKTYGRWFDITDPKQIFKIHLERPPKWY